MLKAAFQHKGMEAKEGQVWRHLDRSDWVEVVTQVLEPKGWNVTRGRGDTGPFLVLPERKQRWPSCLALRSFPGPTR